MTDQQFVDWLRLCPTHKWNIITDGDGYIVISFPIEDEEEE
jgi:hypothetical protein